MMIRMKWPLEQGKTISGVSDANGMPPNFAQDPVAPSPPSRIAASKSVPDIGYIYIYIWHIGLGDSLKHRGHVETKPASWHMTRDMLSVPCHAISASVWNMTCHMIYVYGPRPVM